MRSEGVEIPTLDVSVEEWERRKAYVNFGDEDVRLLRALRPFAERYVDEIVDDLYRHFLHHEETKVFFPDEATIDRVKWLQRAYFLGLFGGNYGEAYLAERIKIGRAHERIGLQPRLYVGSYSVYLQLVVPKLMTTFRSDPGKAERALSALVKIMLLDMDLGLKTYRASNEAIIAKQASSLEKIRRAQAALKESEETYAALVRASPDAVVVTDLDGRVVEVSLSAVAMFEAAGEDELLGKNFLELIAPEDRERAVAMLQRIRNEETIREGEYAFRTMDGDHCVGELHASVVRDAQGTPTTIVAAIRDVTERRRMEVALRLSESRLKGLFEAAAVGIALLADDVPVLTNSALQEMLGYTGEEMGETSLFALTHAEDVTTDRESYEELIAGRRTHYQTEKRLLRKDGQAVWSRLTISSVRDADGRPQFLIGIVEDITDQKKAVEALQESEKKYRMLVDNSLVGIYRTSLDGRVLYANRALSDIFAFDSPEEMVSTGAASRYKNAEDRAALIEKLRRAESVSGVEIEVVTKTGKTKNVLLSARLEGDVISGMVMDVTARKRAEKALHASDAKYRALFENAPVGIGVADPEGNLLAFNDAMLEPGGYGRDDIARIGNVANLYADPAERDRVLKAARRRGHVRQREVRFKRKDGGTYDTLLSLTPVEVDDKPGWLAVVEDITERKRAEKALRESEERFRSTLDGMMEGCQIIGFDWRYLYVNDAVAEHGRLARQDLVGHTMMEAYPGIETTEMFGHLRRCMEERIPHRMENEFAYPDGSKAWSELSIQPVPDGVFILSLDVTERKRAEEALVRQTRELERSNTELARFAYVASHDLQEPLRMVQSYVQLLKRRYEGKLDADAYEFIGYALDGATWMQALIRDLLTFSRLDTRAKPFESIECTSTLEQALVNLDVAIRESGAVITHDPLPTVMGESSQFVQLYQNLISNAIKFRGEEAPRVHVSAKREGPAWLFSVQDNGIGIDPKYAERIFVIFQRLHGRDEYPGTGMGLAICKKIVERHGGRLWVESEPGKGSTFYFTVPVAGGKSD